MDLIIEYQRSLSDGTVALFCLGLFLLALSSYTGYRIQKRIGKQDYKRGATRR